MRLLIACTLAGLLLTGCGQKGPLYKSPVKETNQAQPTPPVTPPQSK
ncbi:lipoprotein [Shewanella yunxiaonensis]|uniref:Lipoprotein n=1 Tax=Shewanella yunxiaonensis TaxID=2829809 RepID=A0ABX7YUP0_9GAMM|nr:lipoprotein [Shewanella yunxiaonensis]QUN06203.1 lipoprotein [Shewanella yunxiaonensis]